MSLVRETANRLDEEGIDFLLLQFVDLTGAAKGKLMPRSAFEDAVAGGAGFAGAATIGLGQGPQSPDVRAIPDLRSYTRLPWQHDTVRFACSLTVNGQPHPYCVRTQLQRALEELQERGFSLQVGFEPEFFLVRRLEAGGIEPWDPAACDTACKPCYDLRAMSPAMDFLRTLLSAMNELGWSAYQADHEDGNGQFEVNFGHADAVTAADRVIFFRMMAAELARPLGAVATFMAKPFYDRTGSGLHAHLHMATRDGSNGFVDAGDPRGLGCSQLAYSFITELLEHAGAMCALNSPTVNCYRRLGLPASHPPTRSGYTWSPREASFGGNNRTHLVRIAGPGNVEDRSISAASNPYLTLLACAGLAARALGRGGDPGEPDHGSAYEREPRGHPLPRTLLEAIDLLEADACVLELLGDLGPEFVRVKSAEAMESERQVSSWELARYLTAL